MTARVLVLTACLFALSAWLGAHAAHGDGKAHHGARSASAPRTAAVYPERPRLLRIDHASVGHRDLACTQCHAASAGAPARRPELPVAEQTCAPCHSERIDRAGASAERCGTCHLGFDPARVSAPAAPRVQPRRLVFSHAKHRATECKQCHAIPQPQAAAGSHSLPALPPMESCFGCHTAERALPCAGCHVAQPSGRLRTSFSDGQLIPRSAFLGLAHDADFSVRHRWLAADHGQTCASCHGEDECAECHDGRQRPRGIHPNDYLALHPQDALRAATRCTSCHATQTFCAACHARLGIAQRSAPDVASPRRFHPPPALWSRGPTLHAREATRALDGCITCHAERDCVECHGSRSRGFGGASPHPPGFVQQCARALARDPRPCLTCHVAGSSLERCR
jgi:hypothetical protein